MIFEMGELVQQRKPEIIHTVVTQSEGYDGSTVWKHKSGTIQICFGQMLLNNKMDAIGIEQFFNQFRAFAIKAETSHSIKEPVVQGIAVKLCEFLGVQ